MEIGPAELEMVRKAAKRFHYRIHGRIEMDELVAEGNLALVRCIDRWKPDGGATLSTYIDRRVTGALLDYLRSQDDLSRDQRAEMGNQQMTISYDGILGVVEGQSVPFVAIIPSDDKDALTRVIENEQMRCVRTVAGAMSRAQRAALHLYYFREIKQSEVAAIIGLSETRTCQLINRGVRKLQHALISDRVLHTGRQR